VIGFVRKKRTQMTSIRTIPAAAHLSVMTATPVFAQVAIQEPGLFSFYYPNLDVLNGGAPTPAARLASEPPSAMQAYAARESGIAVPGTQHYRSHRRTTRHLP
jgi:hypothetical protein